MPASLAVVPSRRTDPGRAALRRAIDDVSSAQAAVAHVESRRAEVHKDRLDAMRRHESAIAALDAVESSRQDRLTELLTGTPAHDAKNLEALKREVDAAAAALSAIEQDVGLLDGEIDRRRKVVEGRAIQRDAAIADVLTPLAKSMLDAVDDLRQRATDIENALVALPAAAKPSNWNVPRLYYAPDPALAAVVADAVAALRTDSDHPLTKLEFTP